MKKYIRFLVFFTLFGIATSIYLSTDFAKKFYSNSDENYSSIKWGDIIEFGTILKGKLYYFDNGTISFSAKNSQQHYVEVYYCKKTQCNIYNQDRVIERLSEIAIPNEDFAKTNEVSIYIPSYEEVFGEYELSYKGWEVQMFPGSNDGSGCMNLMLIPAIDENNRCLEDEDATIEWYKYQDIDLTNNSWFKESSSTSLNETETIEFASSSNDKLVINMKSNTDIAFYIDDKRVTPKEYTTSNTYKYKNYVNYEIDIKNKGNHKLTMVSKPTDDTVISIENMRVLSLINADSKLEEDSLKDKETILERYKCGNYTYESTGIYTKIDS